MSAQTYLSMDTYICISVVFLRGLPPTLWKVLEYWSIILHTSSRLLLVVYSQNFLLIFLGYLYPFSLEPLIGLGGLNVTHNQTKDHLKDWEQLLSAFANMWNQ